MIDLAELFAFCDLHASRIGARRLRDPLEAMRAASLLFYDRQGFPLPDALAWADLMEDPAYKIVAHDVVPDGSVLSTVWLGLDHAVLGPPLFFETMRFAGGDFPHPNVAFPDPETGEDVERLRYGSEEEAAAMHHAILRRLRLQLGH